MEIQSQDVFEDVVDKQALRLTLAFYCILEPQKRDEVMALALRYAIKPPATNGLSCSNQQQGSIKAHDQ